MIYVLWKEFEAFHQIHRYIGLSDSRNTPDCVWRCDGVRIRDIQRPSLLEIGRGIDETGTTRALAGPDPIYMWPIPKAGLKQISHLLDRGDEFL
jgi:hypothetical protein